MNYIKTELDIKMEEFDRMKQEMIDELRKKHAQKKPKTIKNKNQKIIEQLTKQLAQIKAK